jgi:hypothetical protein
VESSCEFGIELPSRLTTGGLSSSAQLHRVSPSVSQLIS